MPTKGGDTTTTTNNTSSSIPSQLVPYYGDLLSRAQTQANQPYQPYNGQRLADFSPDTNQSFSDIRGIAAAGTPALDSAINTSSGIAGYAANPITTQGFNQLTPDQLASYMNPYQANVTDVQQAQAKQQFQEQQAGRDASAVQAGAFGGDRRFVADSLAQRDLNTQLQSLEANGLNTAFNNASNLFTSDQGRSLQAQTANEDARRAGATLGLNAAGQVGALSGQQQDLGLNAASALSGVGSKIQQRQQSGLDLAYQDFQNQRDYPNQQLSLYSQLLSGIPVSDKSQVQAVTSPAPDFLSQLVGLTTSGAGLAKLLGALG